MNPNQQAQDAAARVGAARLHFDEVVEEYDRNTSRRSGYIQEIDERVLALLRANDRKSHLDVGCGSGRLIRRIRSDYPGCRSLGIDVSEGMIEQCRREGLDAVVADFQRFDTNQRFDLITMQFIVFGYLAAQYPARDVLRRAIDFLAPGGVFLFDSLNPYCITHARIRHTLPVMLGRLLQRLIGRAEMEFEYLGRSETPVAVAMPSPGHLVRVLNSMGVAATRTWIRYPGPTVAPWLPDILAAHPVFSCRKR